MDPTVWTIIWIVVALYFLPGVIAAIRGHHNTAAIWVLNIFLGWTFLGWVAALIWSATSPAPGGKKG